MTRRGREASDRLTQALITMASQGLRPNSSDHESHWRWLSEYPQERAQAALMCGGCPVLTECGDAAEANGERFGTWGDRDRTVRPGKAAAAVWLYLLLASSAGVQLVWMTPLAHRPAFLSGCSPPLCPAVIVSVICVSPTTTVAVTVTPPFSGLAFTSIGGAALAVAVPAVKASRAP